MGRRAGAEVAEDKLKLTGVKASSEFARMGDNRVYAVEDGVIRCSPPGRGLWNVRGSQNSSAGAKASTLPSYQTEETRSPE